MFNRSNIEQLLKVNGVAPTAPDEEIKSILVSAKWHKDDVDTALLVLRENKVSHETHVDSLHKIFRSDDHLRPETISSLLGIDVDLTSEDIDGKNWHSKGSISGGQIIQIGLVSLSLSILFILIAMWYLQMGMFHISLR